MSRIGAKTYSRKQECRTSVQFDHLLADKGNKPSTAKVSVAGIHRWGMTTFTSLRKSRMNGGQKETPAAESPDSAKRIKVDTFPAEDPFALDDFPPVPIPVEEKIPARPRVNKFFKSGSSRAPKNADFDAVRMSVMPSSYKNSSVPSVEGFPSFQQVKNEVLPGEEIRSAFMTTNIPNIVDLRPSSSHTTQPNVHYLSPQKQRPDSSSQAFDSLFDSGLQQSQPVDYSDARKDYSDFRKEDLSDDEDDDVQDYSNASKVVKDSREVVRDYGEARMDYRKDYDEPRMDYSEPRIDYTEPRMDYAEPRMEYSGARKGYSVSNMDCSEGRQNYSACNSDIKKSCIEPKKDSWFHNLGQSIERDNQETLNELRLLGHALEDAPSAACDTKPEAEPAVPSVGADATSDVANQDVPDGTVDKKPEEVNGSKSTSRPKKIFSSSLKFKAKYNHRHWQSTSMSEEPADASKPSLADEFEDDVMEDDFSDTLVSEVANTSFGDVRSYKCPKGSKEYYTVVKNVKQSYQCHESGETQEFNDDIEYILECVQNCNAIGTRCLSVLNLAAKCMGPAFRIHLRAHGTMPKIFSALKDAPTDPNLALCTSTLMFVLSQDRLTMDIEASTLSLMLQLLETDQDELRNPEKDYDLILRDPALCAMQDKHREKVNELCKEMQQKGHAKHLKLDNLNTGILAMETLLSLTSRKAGEWFKEEMRTLRGLDRIVDTVTSSTELLLPEEEEIIGHASEIQFDKMRKIDRCLRVLENVTHMNAENQEYLMYYKNSSLIITSLNLIKLCKSHLLEQKPIVMEVDDSSQKGIGSPMVSCILNLLKILSNVTYKIALDDSQFQDGEGLMDNVLMLILQVPRAVAVEKRFDLLVLSLGLLMNLLEFSPSNSTKFIQMYGLGSFDTVNDGYEMPATECLIELMLARLEAARVSEEQADELLSSQEENQAQLIAKKDVETAADDLEETLMKTLQKAGKHMEHSIIAAYIAILLGCVAQKYPDFIETMREYVPEGKFDVMVEVLKKFKSFVTLTGSVGNRELASIQKVVQLLESS